MYVRRKGGRDGGGRKEGREKERRGERMEEGEGREGEGRGREKEEGREGKGSSLVMFSSNVNSSVTHENIWQWLELASFPGHSQILPHSCESGGGLGMRLDWNSIVHEGL